MAQVLYWVVCPSASAGYTDDDTSAGYIKDGKNASGSALPAGTYGTRSAPVTTDTVDATSPPTTQLSPATAYKVAWTIYDDVALTYGGGTANKVEISAEFYTAFEFDADPISIAGALTASGDIASAVALLALVADPIAVAGTLAATGNLGFGIELSATAIPVAGTVTATADIQIGTSFNLATDPIIVTGAVTTTGDIEFEAPAWTLISIAASNITATGARLTVTA